MRALGWLVGGGATLALLVSVGASIVFFGGALFSPGPLSAEHPLGQPISDATAHADFEAQCELCHTPFRGPDGSRCVNCHGDVGDQMASLQGLHGKIPDPGDCSACHPDHKGRAVSLTQTSLEELPHSQFGFSLVRHQRSYEGEMLTCRSCHPSAAQGSRDESAAALAACTDCHGLQDAQFVTEHRAVMGEACLACHDGSDRLQGFDHAAVFPLEVKHARVACTKCHVNNRFRDTPRDCVRCHPDPAVHRGQFGANCAACHTAAGWRPARLLKHSFPLAHGNKSKESACKTCHPTNYAAYSCYGCHDHSQAQMKQVHAKAGIRDIVKCSTCHRTGKKVD